MQTFIAKCPYCQDGSVSYRVTTVNGRKTKIYACSNNIVVKSPDEEGWEKSENSTCDFQIFGNALQRYGKKFIGPKEVKKLLNGSEIIGHLYSFRAKKEYQKYIVIDYQYGIKVLWDEEVEDKEAS